MIPYSRLQRTLASMSAMAEYGVDRSWPVHYLPGETSQSDNLHSGIFSDMKDKYFAFMQACRWDTCHFVM